MKMFAVIEDFKQDKELERISTCLSHVQGEKMAQKILNTEKQLAFDFRVEDYKYRIVEFNGTCPNCNRDFYF